MEEVRQEIGKVRSLPLPEERERRLREKSVQIGLRTREEGTGRAALGGFPGPAPHCTAGREREDKWTIRVGSPDLAPHRTAQGDRTRGADPGGSRI